MSMKRTVILTAVANSNHMRANKTDNRMVKRNDTNYDSGLAVNMNDNVNVVLAGAMLSVLTAMVCVLCYCCNKSINKRSMAIYRQRWMESLNDPNNGIYSVEQFYDSTTSHANTTNPYQGEPPSYEAVMESEKKYAEDEKYLINRRVILAQPCQNCGNNNVQNNNAPPYTIDDVAATDSAITIVPLVDIGPRGLTDCDHKHFNTKDIPDKNGNLSELCNCTRTTEVNGNHVSKHSGSEYMEFDTNSKDDNTLCTNQTIPSTSGEQANGRYCKNCARRMQLPTNTTNVGSSNATTTNSIITNQSNCEENNNDEFDHLNGNGIVRMDMSKIIDSTGLPTYDAALKLESVGYV